jgi:hypothetical protein
LVGRIMTAATFAPSCFNSIHKPSAMPEWEFKRFYRYRKGMLYGASWIDAGGLWIEIKKNFLIVYYDLLV